MSTWWKVLLALLVVAPLAAFVAGSMASNADNDPAPRTPVELRTEETSPTPRTPATSRPAEERSDRGDDDRDDDRDDDPDQDPDDSHGDDGPDDSDDGPVEVITPRPYDGDDDRGDRDDDRGDRDDGGRDDDD